MGNTTPGEEKKVYVLYYYIFNYKIAIFGVGCGGGWGTRKYSHPISVLYSWDLVRKRKSLIHSSLALQRIKQNSLIPRLRFCSSSHHRIRIVTIQILVPDLARKIRMCASIAC